MFLALDPGGTTGYAVAENNTVNDCGQLEESLHHLDLINLLSRKEWDVVICESFQYRNGLSKADLIPVEYIGVARYYCMKQNIPFVLQSPSQAKAFWTNDHIKKAQLWKLGNPHAMDAVRHLLYYICFALKDEQYLRHLR